MSAPSSVSARLLAASGVVLGVVRIGASLAPLARPSPQDAAGPDLGGGPLAALWSGVRAETAPDPELARLAPWPRWEESAWDEEATWQRWSELVRALASTAGEAAATSEKTAGAALGDPSVPALDTAPVRPARLRGELAACALAQSRYDEAWQHLERAREPAALAALLPHFLPGVALDHPVRSGGVPAPLPDGALLAPALPPEPAVDQPFAAREMLSAPFVVGDATLTLRVLFEPGDGVQLDVAHLSGGTATLALRIPCPIEADIARVYLDWDELPSSEPLVRVTLSAAVPQVSVWANLAYRPPAFSRTVPAGLPSAFARAGVRAADGAPVRVRRCAEALATLLAIPLAATGDGPLAPLELRADAAQELAALLSAAERFLLEPAPALRLGRETAAEAPQGR